MQEDRPSRTAYRVALRRAAHQLLDHPPVFSDPLALTVIAPRERAALDANPSAFETHAWHTYLRAFLAARSRVAEDTLADAVAQGVRQYVLLGAGLDTFAFRNPHPQLRVFEVDHPATQAWKRRRFADAGLVEPANASFVPVDFERQKVGDELARHGFDAAAPTFIGWLGVVPYLDAAVVWSNLEWARAVGGRGGGIVFDYAPPPSWWNLLARWRFQRLANRVARIGEPFRALIPSREMVTRLTAFRYATIDDMGPDEINRRCFAGRTDDFCVRAGRIMIARTA